MLRLLICLASDIVVYLAWLFVLYFLAGGVGELAETGIVAVRIW